MAGYLLLRLWETLTTPPTTTTKPTIHPPPPPLQPQPLRPHHPPFYPYVRLNAPTNTVYGYPSHSHSNRLELQNPTLAQLIYILGPSFPSQIITHQFSPDQSQNRCIPVPQGPNYREEENLHCLRMRRCGAAFLRRSYDNQPRFVREFDMKGFLFGWPDGGNEGVWVLSLRVANGLAEGEGQAEEELKGVKSGEGLKEDYERQGRYESLEETLRQQEDMNGFCEILRDEGAAFYERIEECPQVVRFGLGSAKNCLRVLNELELRVDKLSRLERS